jgi:hypothetical protein
MKAEVMRGMNAFIAEHNLSGEEGGCGGAGSGRRQLAGVSARPLRERWCKCLTRLSAGSQCWLGGTGRRRRRRRRAAGGAAMGTRQATARLRSGHTAAVAVPAVELLEEQAEAEEDGKASKAKTRGRKRKASA